MVKQNGPRFWSSFALIALAAALYCSWPLGFALNPVASRAGLASELGAVGQPYAWLFIGSDIVSGILLVSGCILLYQIYRHRSWVRILLLSLAIYGIAGAIDAALPMRCLPSEQVCGPVLRDPMLIAHGITDLIGSIALVITLATGWLYTRKHDRSWLPWIYAVGGGGIIFALLSGVLLLVDGPGYWAQRYYLTLSCIWVASIPFVLRTKPVLLSPKPLKNIRSAARDLAQ